ncbi:MAG TPA: tetratricopeptide repeat protein [Bacteroidales bacterium]|nr:tetratricopeptide repeat protein [Bacteroidales bacterium]
MEEEKFGISHEDEIKEVVQRFERMKKNNENYFFDVIEFETIIDFYIESNNPVTAFEAASIASSQHPNSVSIQLRKARVLLDRGRAVEALRILKKLENIEPGNHEIYIVKGTALGILGDINGAKKMFDTALTKDTDDVENILFSITSVLQNLNYYDHLIPYLKRLLDMEPGFHAHLYDLAYAYEKIQEYENSIKYYSMYLEEEPFSDSAWYNLGIIYNKTEQPDKALEAYDYALAINSQNSFAIFNKANILSNIERYEEAIPVYLEYLENEPESFEAMAYLAECYEKTDNITAAKKYYNEAIDMAPEYADPWIGLGVIAMNDGNMDKSLAYFRSAAKLDPENPEILYLAGKVHFMKGEKKECFRYFRDALRLDGFYDEAWADLARGIIGEELIIKALPLLEKAYKITGDVPGINYTLASLYLYKGNFQAAFRHLSDAIELEPSLLTEYADLFPETLTDKKIKKLLKKYKTE